MESEANQKRFDSDIFGESSTCVPRSRPIEGWFTGFEIFVQGISSSTFQLGTNIEHNSGLF